MENVPNSWSCPVCESAVAVRIYRKSLLGETTVPPALDMAVLAYRCRNGHIWLAPSRPENGKQNTAATLGRTSKRQFTIGWDSSMRMYVSRCRGCDRIIAASPERLKVYQAAALVRHECEMGYSEQTG